MRRKEGGGALVILACALATLCFYTAFVIWYFK
jgi:hypothetical protein